MGVAFIERRLSLLILFIIFLAKMADYIGKSAAGACLFKTLAQLSAAPNENISVFNPLTNDVRKR
jgi:hypothetical protein